MRRRELLQIRCRRENCCSADHPIQRSRAASLTRPAASRPARHGAGPFRRCRGTEGSDAPRPGGPGAGAHARNGAGSDRPGTGERTKRLSVDIPADLHKRFKTACSATGRSMTGELMALVEARTRALEREAGIAIR